MLCTAEQLALGSYLSWYINYTSVIDQGSLTLYQHALQITQAMSSNFIFQCTHTAKELTLKSYPFQHKGKTFNPTSCPTEYLPLENHLS